MMSADTVETSTFDSRQMVGDILAAISSRVSGRPVQRRVALGGMAGEGAMRAGAAIANQVLPGGAAVDPTMLDTTMPGDGTLTELDRPTTDFGNVTPGKDGVPAGLKQNAARGAAAVRQVFGFDGTIGGIGQRSYTSDHPHGNAIDVMTGDDIEFGNQVADYFVRNAKNLGVKYVIFNQQIASAKGGWKWRRMEDRGSDTANHRDHPHISFYE